MNRARRLSSIEYFFLPVLKLLSRPERRAWWARCEELSKASIEQGKGQRAEAAELAREAKVYGELLVRAWARLGSMYIARWSDGSKDQQGRRVRFYKRDYVKFQTIITQPERIWFKILVAKRSLFGRYLDMLPHLVTAGELVDEKALAELTIACQRKVTHFRSAQVGLWVIVNRLEAADGLPALVRYRDVLAHLPDNAGQSGAVCIGIGENRTVEIADLDRQRHWLVGGASGGGKSNMVNCIIATWMRMVHPHNMRLCLIDLKQVEFASYENSPHLYRDVVFEAEEAIEVLQELVAEIKVRTRKLKGRARNITEFNQLYPGEHMARLVVVIDEFAELTIGAESPQQADKAAKLVGRISNLGRAVGIHLLICTQRPAVEVVSNRTKINMDLTLCGRTQNSAQSMTIIGSGAAAELPLIPGRMLALSGSELKPLQTPLIGEPDIQEAISIARGRAAGAITLDGYLPVIDGKGLLDYLAHNGGEIKATQEFYQGLVVLAISRQMFKSWFSGVAKAGEGEGREARYKISKGEGGYQMEVIERFSPPALPAPEPEQPTPEPLPEPVETPITDEVVEDVDEPKGRVPLWQRAHEIEAYRVLREKQRKLREESA